MDWAILEKNLRQYLIRMRREPTLMSDPEHRASCTCTAFATNLRILLRLATQRHLGSCLGDSCSDCSGSDINVGVHSGPGQARTMRKSQSAEESMWSIRLVPTNDSGRSPVLIGSLSLRLIQSISVLAKIIFLF